MPARYLADSNILLRLTKPDDQDYPIVRFAVDKLWADGDELCYTSQNLAEFWSVCTRPADRNGFGLSAVETDRRAQLIENQFTFLGDAEEIHREWRRLIVAHAVLGVQVHDARLVAAMHVHSVTHILTLNDRDFSRYPGIVVVHPTEINS
jgi:predicted nucleic acid-binding protein